MDKIDEKLLISLIGDSRQSISQLAKQARTSRDVAQYRIAQLVKKGIIRDFITNIDHEQLGYVSALLFVSIKADAEREFIEYINKLPFISWAGTHLGFWSLGMAIYGKDTSEVEERFQIVFQKYKNHITNHRFAFYKTTKFFTEKYFGQGPKQWGYTNTKKGEPTEKYAMDDHDKTILKHLAKNSRISCVELSKFVPLTPAAIAQRIVKLERSRIIQGYSIYVNVHKMGLHLFIFFIQNRNLDQRKKLFGYLENHPKVPLLLDYVGDPFIEFGLFVRSPYEARPLIQEIKETFPENELIDFFLTQEDFISFGTPDCVLE